MPNDVMREREAIAAHLIGVWKKILGKDVSPSEDFFAAGGDSLAAIKMITEVQRAYQVDLDVETFFEEPSIARLVSILSELQSGGAQETHRS